MTYIRITEPKADRALDPTVVKSIPVPPVPDQDREPYICLPSSRSKASLEPCIEVIGGSRNKGGKRSTRIKGESNIQASTNLRSGSLLSTPSSCIWLRPSKNTKDKGWANSTRSWWMCSLYEAKEDINGSFVCGKFLFQIDQSYLFFISLFPACFSQSSSSLSLQQILWDLVWSLMKLAPITWHRHIPIHAASTYYRM